MKDVDGRFLMGKKRYFLNFFYLSLCAFFISMASFLNFQDSTAKQITGDAGLNTEFYSEEQDETEDQEESTSAFELLPKIENKYESYIASSYSSSNPHTSATTASTTYSSYITIANNTLRIEDVNDTLIDSTDHVNRWGKKFLYGHNTSKVFGPIRSLSNGATFTVLMDGQESTYQIMYTETMERPKVEKNMLGIAYATYNGVRYDLSLMTCAGTSLGGGDATHRFVIFANKIS